jgi:hypothetical protein
MEERVDMGRRDAELVEEDENEEVECLLVRIDGG